MISELQSAVSKNTFASILLAKEVGGEPERVASPQEADEIKLETASSIYRGVPMAAVAGLVNGIIAASVGWPMVNHVVLMVWTTLVFMVCFARLFLWAKVRGKRSQLAVMERFKNRNMIAMGVNGMLWGMLAPIFAVYGQIGHVFLPFILAGMTAAAIVSSGACWKCVLCFNIPALLPMAAAFFFWGGEGATMISTVIILYGIVTSFAALQTSQMIGRAIMLRSKNATLVEALDTKIEEASLAEKRYKALIESSREATFIFSPEGRVTYANRAAGSILGKAPDALIDMTTRDLMHEDDLLQFQAEGSKTLAMIGDVRPLPPVCLRHDEGHFVPLSGRLTNMLYVSGVEGFVFSGSVLAPDIASRLHAAE